MQLTLCERIKAILCNFASQRGLLHNDDLSSFLHGWLLDFGNMYTNTSTFDVFLSIIAHILSFVNVGEF